MWRRAVSHLPVSQDRSVSRVLALREGGNAGVSGPRRRKFWRKRAPPAGRGQMDDSCVSGRSSRACTVAPTFTRPRCSRM